MTLLFMDGCHAGDQATKYNGTTGTSTRTTSTPPVTGGAYYTMTSSSTILSKSFTAASEVIVHCRVRMAGLNSTYRVSFWGDSGTTRHVTFDLNLSTAKIQANRSSSTLLATGTFVYSTTTWMDLQLRVTIHDSTGIAKCRVNGAGSEDISFTGDTKNAGTNSTIDTVTFERSGPTNNVDFTDIVIMDTAGSVNNDWPGEVTIYTLTPNGNGNTSDFLGSDSNSTDNYLLVDELPFSDSDYVGGATSATGDTYTMTDLTGSPTVKALAVNTRMGKSDAGAQFGKIRVRSGGTTYASGSKTPPGSGFSTITEIYETDPNTASAWTASNVNAVECGAEVA